MILIGVLAYRKEKKHREKLERIDRAKMLTAETADPAEGSVMETEVTT